MKTTVALRPNNKTFSSRCTRNLSDALDARLQLRSEITPASTDLLIHWGYKATPALKSALAQNIPFIILDRGYFEPTRTDRVSLSFNGFHGLGLRDPDVLDRAPRPHPEYSPWRADGQYALVCGQVPGDAALRGIDCDAWMHRAANAAQEEFGLPVVKRPHPKALETWERTGLVSFEQALSDAAVCITFSSTMGVQSVIAGVPTVAMHKGSMAYDMAAHDMSIVTPSGRDAWLHELAWREFDLTSSGDTAIAARLIRDRYADARRAAASGHYNTQGLRL